MAGRKQFDVDAALDQAMTVFWERGYTATTVDDLTAATGLGRSSLYATFGDKEALFLACLERYARRYGELYDAALANAAEDPSEAVAAFFDVTLDRIADPSRPDGCLVAQTVMTAPSLPVAVAARASALVGHQRGRLRRALDSAPVASARRDDLALHLAAVNQSLAVLSRGGAAATDLRAVVAVALVPVQQALAAVPGRCGGTEQ
ncbi:MULTISPECIES: TetR/AcrR family transcriptional regulator [unclassified Pseudonocardia]|uniref:TetR/AcrR family transcriptional regulator n=1 Tax=unclassified Pseudonocardia TaxID=2619320 RepID=UPI001CF62EE3|nr:MULTISPECIES: TetR/AcrR family transcriptional regulator [unclassified Pseudonocardia]